MLLLRLHVPRFFRLAWLQCSKIAGGIVAVVVADVAVVGTGAALVAFAAGAAVVFARSLGVVLVAVGSLVAWMDPACDPLAPAIAVAGLCAA